MERPRTYHRTLAWALVLVFTVVSVILNGMHAVMQWDGQEGGAFGAVLLAVMAPVSLLLATHLLVGLIQDWTHRRRWLVRLRGTVAGVFAVIGVIAFVMSFAALRDMAERYGMVSGLSWMAPVIIDSVILAGTLAVVIAEAEMRLDREEAAATRLVKDELTAREPQLTVPVTSRADGPSVSSALELTDVTDELTTVEPVSDDDELTVSEPVSRSGRTDEAQVNPVTKPAIDELTTLEQVVSDDVVSAETVVSDDVPLMSPDDAAPVSSSVTTVDERTDGAATDGGLIVLAEQVRSRKGLRAPAPKVAAALEQAAAGQSPTAIAKEIGGSHNTIRGWIEEARDLDAEFAARLDGKPQLVAVGND